MGWAVLSLATSAGCSAAESGTVSSKAQQPATTTTTTAANRGYSGNDDTRDSDDSHDSDDDSPAPDDAPVPEPTPLDTAGADVDVDLEPTLAAAGAEVTSPACPLGWLAAADGTCASQDTGADSDGDGISDFAEVYGVLRADGTVLDLAALGAGVGTRDVFLEIDYLPGRQPSEAAIGLVQAAFLNAPATSSGSVGVALHATLGHEVGAEYSRIDISFSQIDAIKQTYGYDTARAGIFHYVLFADQLAVPAGMQVTAAELAQVEGSSGLSQGIPGENLVVTLGAQPAHITADRWAIVQAGTLMHELGHNLGLYHGGFTVDAQGQVLPDQDNKNKPHYLSVMNYNYQMEPFVFNDVFTLDYARYNIAGVDSSALNEVEAFAPGWGTTEQDLAQYTGLRMYDKTKANYVTVLGNASSQLDFNNNGSIETAPYSLDVSGTGYIYSYLGLVDDWSQLNFLGPSTSATQTVTRVITLHDCCAPRPNE